MNKRLSEIEHHMNSLGYTRKDIVDREVIMVAFKHESEHTIFFISERNTETTPLQAQARFFSEQGLVSADSEALREMNRKLIITTVEYGELKGKCEVTLRSHYTGVFEKEAFDIWLRVFKGEVEEVLNDANFRKFF